MTHLPIDIDLRPASLDRPGPDDPSERILWLAAQAGVRMLQSAEAQQLDSFELGSLFRVIRGESLAEEVEGLSFAEWVGKTFRTARNKPRPLRWAERLMQVSRVLEPWSGLRRYHRERIQKPLETPCQAPVDDPRWTPRGQGPRPHPYCVTVFTTVHAARLVVARRVEWAVMAELEAQAEEEQRALEPLVIDRMGEAAFEAAEQEAIILAHYASSDLQELVNRLAPRYPRSGPVDGLRRKTLDLAPETHERLERALEWTSTYGGATPTGNPDTRYRRLADFVLGVAERLGETP